MYIESLNTEITKYIEINTNYEATHNTVKIKISK